MKYSLAPWTSKFNYYTSIELAKAPSHCLYSISVIDSSETPVGLMVIDYYTPKNKKHGWWLALRGAGYQRGVHPHQLIFIKKGLLTPSMDQLVNAEEQFKDLLNSGLLDAGIELL